MDKEERLLKGIQNLPKNERLIGMPDFEIMIIIGTGLIGIGIVARNVLKK